MRAAHSHVYYFACFLIVASAYVVGCDNSLTPPDGAKSETDIAMENYRKTLPPVPDSLKPLVDEMQQLVQKRNPNPPPLSARESAVPVRALPGLFPYRMAEGGRLVEIVLTHTPATDEFVQKLATLAHLEKIDLSGTLVTDAAWEHLAKLPALIEVAVWQTQMTDEAANKFREEHPTCNVRGPNSAKQ